MHNSKALSDELLLAEGDLAVLLSGGFGIKLAAIWLQSLVFVNTHAQAHAHKVIYRKLSLV